MALQPCRRLLTGHAGRKIDSPSFDYSSASAKSRSTSISTIKEAVVHLCYYNHQDDAIVPMLDIDPFERSAHDHSLRPHSEVQVRRHIPHAVCLEIRAATRPFWSMRLLRLCFAYATLAQRKRLTITSTKHGFLTRGLLLSYLSDYWHSSSR